MSEKFQNDLMHVQNELLGDLKNVENRIEAKIKKINQSIDEQKNGLEKKLNYLENAYTVLLQRTQNAKTADNSKEEEILSKIEMLNKKIEDHSFKLENKYNSITTELKDTTYKYDKIMSDNFQIPGLIGYRAPFLSMREFLENVNKKLNDTSKIKDQQAVEFKKYKEKMENSINVNKNQFSMLENRINSKIDLQMKDLEKRYDDRLNVIEERINTMRMENGKYSYDLLAQCNDLNDKCNKIDDILKSTLDSYNDEFIKYKNTFKRMNEKLNKFEGLYKSFEEKLELINEQFVNNNKNNSSHILLEKKIKDLEKMYLSMKSENYFSNFEERKNKSNILENLDNNDLSKTNKQEENIEEDDINSLFSNRQIKKVDSYNIKIDQKTISARNYSKGNELYNSEDRDEPQNHKNILFDSELLKDSKNIKGLLNNSNMMSKTKDSSHRIRSGKIFNKFPFISYDRKSNTDDIMHSLSRNNFKYGNKGDFRSNDNIFKSEENKNIIQFALNYKDLKRKQIEKESSKDTNVITYHKYKYLDKKIDILGRVMVESLNKIIVQMNFLKKNTFNNPNFIKIKSNNNKSSEEYNNNPENSEQNDKTRNLSKNKTHLSLNFKNFKSLHQNTRLNFKSKFNQNSSHLNKENKKNKM